MSKIFGGSKQKSESKNLAFPQIQQTFSPTMQYANQGAGGVAALLGGDSSGFNKYLDATGFDFMSDRGSRGIVANQAAKGLLRSGSTGQRLVEFGEGIRQNFANQYLQNLFGLSDVGLKAGGLLAQAGQTSQSSGRSKPGIGGFLGAALSGGAAGG